MRLEDFDFNLPPDRIAQRPADRRQDARLLVLERENGRTENRNFSELVDFLRAGDLLVLNDTRVCRWRIPGRKPTGGKVEVLLIRPLGDLQWEALVRGVARGPVHFEEGLRAEVTTAGPGPRTVVFSKDPADFIHRHGSVPLPPYIRRVADEHDHQRYQTVYARHPGAVAAPTAGLHFTDPLLKALAEKGIRIRFLTLHVGPGTFSPVRAPDLRDHRMDAEWYDIPRDTADAVNEALREKRRIVAVGTTVTRTLETAYRDGAVQAGSGASCLFIVPGFRFQVIRGLLTNFHLPKATPLMLVSAFSDREKVLRAYREAVSRQYRFFSYGDAMLVL